MRVGPSRLISTAVSSGESNDTVAAEWMTTSHDASTCWSSGDRPRPSRPTSPRIVVIRWSVIWAKPSRPCCWREPVEGVVLEQLALDTLRRGRPLAAADQQHEVAVGDAAQQALDQRRADEPGRAGDGDPFAGERLGDHELQV